MSSGKAENLSEVDKDINLIIGDVRNPDVVSKEMKRVEIVFNLAAMHGGRGYIETHPVECMNNMLLDHIVFENAAKNGVETIVHASSACVYPTNLQDKEEDGIFYLKRMQISKNQEKLFQMVNMGGRN